MYCRRLCRAASFPQNYDLIISSLSIHHLPDPAKRKLYKKIYAHLEPGGIFVNADQVRGETPEIEQFYREKWIQQVVALGATAQELTSALERMREDRSRRWHHGSSGCMPLFIDVNCWYRNYSFAVWGGSRACGGEECGAMRHALGDDAIVDSVRKKTI